jgi:hypothetical protein
VKPEDLLEEEQLVNDLIALSQEVVAAQRILEPPEATAERRRRVRTLRRRIRTLKRKHLGHD